MGDVVTARVAGRNRQEWPLTHAVQGRLWCAGLAALPKVVVPPSGLSAEHQRRLPRGYFHLLPWRTPVRFRRLCSAAASRAFDRRICETIKVSSFTASSLLRSSNPRSLMRRMMRSYFRRILTREGYVYPAPSRKFSTTSRVNTA